MADNINPAHYQYDGFEVYDVLRQVFPNDPIGWQIGKYVLRADRKNGLEDWRKARWYLEKKIEELEAAADPTGLTVCSRADFDAAMTERGFVRGRLGNWVKAIDRVPRVFESWRDIPDDVTAVEVNDGGIARRLGDGWSWSDVRTSEAGAWQWSDDYQDDAYLAPYTEVIE